MWMEEVANQMKTGGSASTGVTLTAIKAEFGSLLHFSICFFFIVGGCNFSAIGLVID